MTDAWRNDPLPGDEAPPPRPNQQEWEMDPPAGPKAQPLAVVKANDNADEASQAYKIGRRLGVAPTVVQSDVAEYGAADKRNLASRAAQVPALAKYIEDNPMGASISSDDWDHMVTASQAWDALKQQSVNGVSLLKSLDRIREASLRGYKEGVEGATVKTPTGVSDDFIKGMQRAGIFRDPGSPYVGLQALNEAMIIPMVSLINRGLAQISGLVHDFGETTAQSVREFGTPPSLVAGDVIAEGSKYTFSMPKLEFDMGDREAAARRAKGEAVNFATYMMNQNPITPRVGKLVEGPRYVSVEEFLGRVQALTDREAIDAFIKNKETQQGPILMITKADHAKAVMDQAVEVAQQSKTKERSPDHYAAAVGATTDDVVHIPAEKILELYRSAKKVPEEGDGLFGFVPNLAKQLESASQNGTEITISAAQYIAHIDPAVHAKLSEDLRLHDDGVTVTEAKEAEEAYAAQQEKAKELEQQAKDLEAELAEPDEIIPPEKPGQEVAERAIEGRSSEHPEWAKTYMPGDTGDRIVYSRGNLALREGFIEGKRYYTAVKNFGEGGGIGGTAYDVRNSPENSNVLNKLEKEELVAAIERLEKRNKILDLQAQAETTKGKPGANTSRLANLLSQNLYGDERNMATVSVKEMVQNAFDAIKGQLEKGLLKNGGRITVDMNRNDRTITITDNGSGMKPEVLGKQFLEIAGTEKETQAASGGLGIAKMQFLFGNKELHVITLRDGKVSEMRTNGNDLKKALAGDADAAPDIHTRIMSRKDRELFPDGHGTIVKVTVPESYVDVATGEEKSISFDTWRGAHPVIERSPLFNNIELIYRGETQPVGKNFPAQDFTQFANVNFDWGTARIYVTKESIGERYGDNMHVLSNGLWQFSLELKKDPRQSWGPNIDRTFYLDVNPRVAPDQPGYPFELSRQGFSPKTRKDFGKIFQYIQRAYQQLDFASSAKNFGDIQYLDFMPSGVKPSAKEKLQPEGATRVVEKEGLKAGDQVEVIDGKLIVGGREIPELKPEDLKSDMLDIDSMTIDQSKIDPQRVMLHDNIEVQIKEPAEVSYEQQPFDEETFSKPELYKKSLEFEGEQWVSLVDAARERFPERFDLFMFEVGEAFLTLRDFVADNLNYPDLRKEGIGISFDPEYRGVSIRLPFSASFVNPVLTVYADPMRAAVGVIGTMIHELAHHQVRSHNAEFPAEMQKIQIALDVAEVMGSEGVHLTELKKQMVEIYERNKDIFDWTRSQIIDGESGGTVRTRGKRFKDSGEVAGRDAGAAGDTGAGRDGGLGPSYQRVGGRPDDLAAPSDPQGPGAIAGGLEESAKAEKRQLYLHPLFKDGKSVGITAIEFRQYSRKLERAEADILDRAIKLHRNQIKKALSAEWKRDEATLREQVTAELKEAGPFAAEKFLREHKIDLKPENADDFAALFGYKSGGDLLANLGSIEAQKLAGISLEKQLKMTIDEQVAQEMKERHGDLAQKIADEAREIATDGHTFDILDFEMRKLAEAGNLPLPLEKKVLIASAKESFEDMLLQNGANYAALRRAVEKAGREAEKTLLKGDFQEAFHAKQRQFIAAVHMRESNRLQRTIDSVEKKVDKFTSKQIIPAIMQVYTDQIRAMLQSVGIPQNIQPAEPLEPLRDFVADSEGQLAVAPWLMAPGVPTFEQMTVAQFREFQLSMRSMEHVGALANKVVAAHKEASLQNFVFDAVKEMQRYNPIEQPSGGARHLTLTERLRSAGRKVIGFHLLVEKVLDNIDQYNPHGPITEFLDRPLRDANVKELELTEKITKMIREMYELKDNSVLEPIPNDLIPDKFTKNGLMKLDRGNLREIMLNMGNWSNLEKLTRGFGIEETDLRRFVDQHARPEDVKFVNAIWRIFAVLKPEADAVHTRDTGVPVDTIPPVEWDIAGGKLTGGYYPIVYDRYNSNIQGHRAKQGSLFDPHYVMASTPHRYTLERTGYEGPLDITGTFLASRIQSMIHDIAFREAVRNANRVISNQEFITAVGQFWGKEVADLFPGWLRDIANSHTMDSDYAKGLAKAIAMTRQNIVSTLVAWNPSTFIKHGATAAIMSAYRVGLPEFVSALRDLGFKESMTTAVDLVRRQHITPDQAFIDATRDMLDQGERGESVRRFVLQSSAVMRNRNRQVDDSISGSIEKLNDLGAKGAFKSLREKNILWGRLLIAYFDQMSAVPTWWAAYKTAFAKGESHADAVFIADKEVSRAHGSGFVGDQPYVTRLSNSVGGEFLKTFVPLYKFYNHFANMNFQFVWDANAYLRSTKQLTPPGAPPPLPPKTGMVQGDDGGWYYPPEPGANAAQLSKWVVAVITTLIIEELAAPALDKDKKGILHSILMKALHLFGGQFIGLREITSGAAHGYGPSAGLWGTMARAGEATVKDLAKAGGVKAGVAKNWIRNTATIIGFITGLGGAQVGRTAQGVFNMARGKEVPRGSGLDKFNQIRQALRTGSTKPRIH